MKKIMTILTLLIISNIEVIAQTNSKTFLWPYNIPRDQSDGPARVQVHGEYSIKKSAFKKNNGNYGLLIRFTISRIKFDNNIVYKHKGIEYSQASLHAADGRGYEGFNELEITGISITFPAIKGFGVINEKDFTISRGVAQTGGFGLTDEIAEFNGEDYDLDKISVMTPTSFATSIKFENSSILVARIEKILKQKEDEKEYKNIISEADKANSKKNYAEAKKLYEKASRLLPNENYPKAQLSKIDKEEKKEQEKLAVEKIAKEKANAEAKVKAETKLREAKENNISETQTNKTETSNYQSELERIRQAQISKNEELKIKQQLAKEENERKQRQQLEELQAQLAENRRKSEALNAASDEAFKQWDQGNYIEGTRVLANEYAEQGKTDAALATVAVGAGLDLATSIIETNRRHQEEKERRAEQARIAEENKRRLEAIEEEKRQILEQQKREFNKLVEENRMSKKSIINQRDRFLDTKTELTPTYDVFSDDNLPIYIFYVQAEKDYNYYNENVSFPDFIDININESASLHFSPIIAISPNSSGEYPFIKEILSIIKSEYIDIQKGKYKIYNWSRSLEEIQNTYNQEVSNAIDSNFTVVFPNDKILNYLEKMNTEEEENSEFDYWGENSKTNKSNTESQESVKNIKKNDDKVKEINYWD